MTWGVPEQPRFYMGQLVRISGPRRHLGSAGEFSLPYSYNEDPGRTVDLHSVGKVWDPQVDGDGEISVRWAHFPGDDEDSSWYWPADRLEPADPAPDLTKPEEVEAWLTNSDPATA